MTNDLEALLVKRRDQLEELDAEYRKYTAKLEDLSHKDAELVKRAAEFDEFITEHVLWQRSASLFDLEEIADLPEAARMLFAPAVWREAGFI